MVAVVVVVVAISTSPQIVKSVRKLLHLVIIINPKEIFLVFIPKQTKTFESNYYCLHFYKALIVRQVKGEMFAALDIFVFIKQPMNTFCSVHAHAHYRIFYFKISISYFNISIK